MNARVFLLALGMPILLIVGDSSAAEPCRPYAPDRGKRVDDVLKEAKQILLVHVRSASKSAMTRWEGENVTYHLDVVQVLKGNEVRSSIKLGGVRMKHGFLFDPSLLDATYRHSIGLRTAETLEQANVTREPIVLAGRRGMCEFAPYFEVGLDYLILLGAPYSKISFEPIISPEDAWFLRVAKTFENENREPLLDKP